MKYVEQIDGLLKDLLWEDWMDEDDYEDMIKNIFHISGHTKQTLSDNLETGLKNGYSIEDQLALTRTLAKSIFKEKGL